MGLSPLDPKIDLVGPSVDDYTPHRFSARLYDFPGVPGRIGHAFDVLSQHHASPFHRKMDRSAPRLGVLLLTFCVCQCGCVERRMTVRTQSARRAALRRRLRDRDHARLDQLHLLRHAKDPPGQGRLRDADGDAVDPAAVVRVSCRWISSRRTSFPGKSATNASFDFQLKTAEPSCRRSNCSRGPRDCVAGYVQHARRRAVPGRCRPRSRPHQSRRSRPADRPEVVPTPQGVGGQLVHPLPGGG